MNILILSWRGIGHPNEGGAEISTQEHAKGWVADGNTVVLFTSSYPGSQSQEIIDGVSFVRKGNSVFGVQIEAYKWFLFSKHPKFDVVIDQFHGIPFFTPIYVKTKKLAFIHEVAKEVWGLNSWPMPFNLIPKFLGIYLEPIIFKTLYKKIPFMTVSKSTKDELIQWGIPKDNITVIYNGLEKPLLKNNVSKNNKKTFIFLGALAKDKGIENALQIFKQIDNKVKGCSFWIVGKGEKKYTDKLKLQVTELGIQKNTKFWGFINNNLKYELLKKAHILINPSIREGWSLVVMEAASVGTPTIGYNVSGLKDSVINGKTGILVARKNLDELVEEAINLINDETRYNRISKEALRWSSNFSWEKASKESMFLLKKLTS